MYIEFDTYQAAFERNEAINNACIGVIWVDGITNNYSEIIEHEGKFYLIYMQEYREYFTNDELGRVVDI
jgi:uncharacterized protein YqkB